MVWAVAARISMLTMAAGAGDGAAEVEATRARIAKGRSPEAPGQDDGTILGVCEELLSSEVDKVGLLILFKIVFYGNSVFLW